MKKKNKSQGNNERFLIMRNVYDLGQMTVQAIQAAVQQDFDNYFRQDIVGHPLCHDLQITLVFDRNTDIY